jgi:hypothetical protein
MEYQTMSPVLLFALGGFLVGVAITRLNARLRIGRLRARLEAAEFEVAQLRADISVTATESG